MERDAIVYVYDGPNKGRIIGNVIVEVARPITQLTEVLDWYAKTFGFDRSHLSGSWVQHVIFPPEKTERGRSFISYQSKPNFPRLGSMMQELVEQVEALARNAKKTWGKDDHHGICTEIAGRYGLTSTEDAFPVWLSRVVEGVIRDVAESPNGQVPI